MTDPGRAFLDRSRIILGSELLPRISRCIRELSEEDLWWRPNDVSNSVGNLVPHLEGNTRQWIISGVGGEPDRRRREEEFARRAGISGEELLESITSTVRQADGLLERLPPDVLQEERFIQGRQVSVLDAVYHVVEHFSMHTGQIIYITKLRTGRDLQFYRLVDGIPRASWEA